MNNNFNFLRLLCAIFVVITHSYPLTGASERDLLETISEKQVWFSAIGVNALFIISGYLIFQSLCRSNSLIGYYLKRLLRIFPALFVVLLITLAFVFLVYQGDFNAFIHDPSVRSYFPNNFFLYNMQYDISGIFEKNPLPNMINGSLWTIAYEFTLYLILSLLFFFNLITKRIVVSLLFFLMLIGRLFFTLNTAKFHGVLNATYFYDFALYFFSGSFLAAVGFELWGKKRLLSLSALLLLAISIIGHVYSITAYFLMPVLVISAGLDNYKSLNAIVTKIGDLSYGIYIYSFMIMQFLMHFFKLGTISLMLWGLIISFLFALFSWHCVEKRALDFKSSLKSI